MNTEILLFVLSASLFTVWVVTMLYYRFLLHQITVCRDTVTTRLHVERVKRIRMSDRITSMEGRLDGFDAKLNTLDNTLAEAIEASVPQSRPVR